MTQRLLLSALALSALLSSGCQFWKKTPKSTENPSIPGSVEDSFKTRWIDKRSAELAAQGKSGDAARSQATAEYAEKFAYTGGLPKK
jgi:hypothetical protein